MRQTLKTLKIILSLRNTINVNGILYGIRHIPIIGKYISDRIYGIRVLKILAMIVSVNTEIIKASFGKVMLFGFLFLASGALSSLNGYSQSTIFMYGFVLASIVAMFLYNLFHTTTETEYGVFLLGMDAKKYVKALFLFDSASTFLGYAILGIPAALISGVPWYCASLIPFAGVGAKAITLGLQMTIYSARVSSGGKYTRKGKPVSIIGNPTLSVLAVIAIPAVGFIAGPMVVLDNLFVVPALLTVLLSVIVFPAYILIRRFPYGMYRSALFAERSKREVVKKEARQSIKKTSSAQITDTAGVSSNASGFRYLNELFVMRHRKLLWGSLIKIVIGIAAVIAVMSIFLYVELKRFDEDPFDSLIRSVFTAHLSGFPFVLYFINRGAQISQTMFANCDSSLLMFGFYKTPKSILTMFRLRIRSMIKLNFLPAFMIAVYSVVVIAVTGGEEYRFQYLFTFLSIILLMMFFSVHHLAVYYLLQPYTSEFKIKSKGYQIVSFVVYFVCWMLFNNNVSAIIFAPAAAAFTIIYIVTACLLVYKFAPKTFRIK
ncbi:hypothetical protein SAMN02910456_00150 [Ruminococcaceae bacterium YRB3002]|nr:hypothetical protein SAMN02910456_00150 [Ruminococcaceae bacterium YRB3002]